MTFYGAGLIFALGCLSFAYFAVGRKAWRGETAFDGTVPPAWWPFSLPVWRGVGRSFVAVVPFLLVMFIGGLIAEFSSAEDLGLSIAALGLLGVPFIQAPIVFFNRPRWLVPPHQRDEPGALEEWRTARRRRTH